MILETFLIRTRTKILLEFVHRLWNFEHLSTPKNQPVDIIQGFSITQSTAIVRLAFINGNITQSMNTFVHTCNKFGRNILMFSSQSLQKGKFPKCNFKLVTNLNKTPVAPLSRCCQTKSKLCRSYFYVYITRYFFGTDFDCGRK